MILVTGATGLVGSHLLFKLLSKNKPIRAIYRRAHKLEVVKKVFSYYTNDVDLLYAKIEWIEADITDIPKLTKAFTNVDYVYHCAAFVSFEPDKYDQLKKINIEGTANIVNLALANAVKKLCFVSSIAAIGPSIDKTAIINEEQDWNADLDHSVYALTKHGAEMEVWRASQEGLDCIIINPGVIIGPGLWHGGGSSGIFKKVHKGMPYYTQGSTAYIDVNDVVDIMVFFMQSDIKNERYILATESLTYKHFLASMARELKVEQPKKMAGPLLLGIAWRLDWLKNKMTNTRRSLSKQMANTLLSKSNYDNAKLKSVYKEPLIPIAESIKTTAKLYLKDLKE